MLRIVIFATLALFSTSASATCIGSDYFQNCTDSSGNSYTINRFGSTTMMQGRNAQTGSSWTHNSTTMGNTTFHNGNTNGRNWNMMQTQHGNGFQTFSGSDSRGNSIYRNCGPLGCF